MEEKYPLAQWLADDMTESEKIELMSSSEFATLAKIKKYSAQLKTSDFDDQKMLDIILSSKKKQDTSVVPMYTNWLFKIAAILVIGLGITMFYQNMSVEKQMAANGKKTSFILPDNSEVVLNSGSEIQYKKSNWDRTVQLDGEAYFKVAKGKRFEVNTNLGKVGVLGTQFDVKSRGNRFDVTCFEGRVQVNYNKYQVLLSGGQSISFEKGKQFKNTVVATKPDWLNNKIAFDKENLEQVVAEIERNYDVKIKLNLFDTSELFTGKIPSDSLDVALNIIATTYQLKIRKDSSKSIIFEKK